jgi:hypothetical protein
MEDNRGVPASPSGYHPSGAEPEVAGIAGIPNAAWVPMVGRYQSGEKLLAGPVKVAEAAYNGMRSKGDPKTHKAIVNLPGLRVSTFHGESMEEVKTYAERAVRDWFKAVMR